MSPQARSCLLRSLIQRVNGSLGSVMSEPNVTSGSVPSLPEAVADSDLRWHNTVLTRVRKQHTLFLNSPTLPWFILEWSYRNCCLPLYSDRGCFCLHPPQLLIDESVCACVMWPWYFTFLFLLWQEVSDKNRRISMLELEKDALLEQLDELQTHWLITRSTQLCKYVFKWINGSKRCIVSLWFSVQNKLVVLVD